MTNVSGSVVKLRYFGCKWSGVILARSGASYMFKYNAHIIIVSGLGSQRGQE